MFCAIKLGVPHPPALPRCQGRGLPFPPEEDNTGGAVFLSQTPLWIKSKEQEEGCLTRL